MCRYYPLLINPPVCSPLLPTANLAILKGSLENQGLSSKVIDANLEFFLHIFSAPTLEDAIHRIAAKGNLVGNQDHVLVEEIDNAIDFIRSRTSVAEPLDLLRAYNKLNLALAIYSRSFSGLNLGMNFLKLAYSRESPPEILAALDDTIRNPFQEFFRERLGGWLESLSDPLVGISISFQDQLIPAFSLAQEIRKFHPEIPIVFGGQIPTRCADDLLSDRSLMQLFDALVLYEGEVQLCAMVKESIESWQNIPNVVRRVGNDVIKSKIIGPECAAPDPDREGSLSYEDLPLDSYLLPESILPIQMSRGCYYNKCQFCAIPSANNSPYRTRSPEAVFEDMKTLDRQYRIRYGRPLRYFKLVDSSPKPQLLLDLSDIVRATRVDYRWECYARLERVFSERSNIKRLYDGGCRKVYWGLESADSEILRSMRKGIEIGQASRILHFADEEGILNFAFVIFGFPGESERQIENTMRYIVENQSLHTVTLASFDLTRNSNMVMSGQLANHSLAKLPAEGIVVRYPYLYDGALVKDHNIKNTYAALVRILSERADILMVSLFQDSLRTIMCDKLGNCFGRDLATRYDTRKLLLNVVWGVELGIKQVEAIDAGVSQREVGANYALVPTLQMQTRHLEDVLREALGIRLQYQIRRIDQL